MCRTVVFGWARIVPVLLKMIFNLVRMTFLNLSVGFKLKISILEC